MGEQERILDIGCGNGRITAAIADRVPQGSVEVLDRYQVIAADNPTENNTFKFYQMEVVLVPV